MKNLVGRHPEYFESILQLRPVKDEILDFIREMIQSRDDVHITKVVELKTGIDIYFDNQKFVRGALAQQLKRRFKGKLVITRTLYGQHKMTSRLLYRATVLFRIDEDKKEDSLDN